MGEGLGELVSRLQVNITKKQERGIPKFKIFQSKEKDKNDPRWSSTGKCILESRTSDPLGHGVIYCRHLF